MIVSDFKNVLESVGCWPPKCHICLKEMKAHEYITYIADNNTEEGTGLALLAGCHPTCVQTGAKPEKPKTNKRGNGCFLTTGDLLRVWHPDEVYFDPAIFLALSKLPSTPNIAYPGDDTL